MGPLIPRWRAQFPYRTDADDVVSRREFLRFSILGSGALFAGTVVLALLAPLRRGPLAAKAVVKADELGVGQARYFRYPGPDDEAVVVNTKERGLVAYSQRCTHLSCAVTYEPDRDRLYCPCHDGVFSTLTGEPIAGPPQRALPRIVLERRGDTIFAVDEVP